MRALSRLTWRICILLGLVGAFAFAEAAPTVEALHISPRWGQPLNGRLIFREAIDGSLFKVRLATAEEYRARGLRKADFLDSVSVYSDPRRPLMPVISGMDPVAARQFDVLIFTQDGAGSALTNFSVSALSDGYFEVTRSIVQVDTVDSRRDMVSSVDGVSKDNVAPVKIPSPRVMKSGDSTGLPRVQRHTDTAPSVSDRASAEGFRQTEDEPRVTARGRIDQSESLRLPSRGTEKVALISSAPAVPMPDATLTNGTSRALIPESSRYEDAFTINKMNLIVYLLVTLLILVAGYALLFVGRRSGRASLSPGVRAAELEGKMREPQISSPSSTPSATAGRGWEAGGGAMPGADRAAMGFGSGQSVNPEVALANAAAQQSYAATAARLKQQYYKKLEEEASALKVGRDTSIRADLGVSADRAPPAAKDIPGRAAYGAMSASSERERGSREVRRRATAPINPQNHGGGLPAQASAPSVVRRPISPAPPSVEPVNRDLNPSVTREGRESSSGAQAIPGQGGATDAAARSVQSRPMASADSINPNVGRSRPDSGAVSVPRVMTPVERMAPKPVAGNVDGPERQKIELAAVYMSMGDLPTARILLREVMTSPNTNWHARANELLNEINGLDK